MIPPPDLLMETREGCVAMETLLTLYDLKTKSVDEEDFYRNLKAALPIAKDELVSIRYGKALYC